MADEHGAQSQDIHVLPGQWRPHYRFEQIAWISPPWPTQDYIWLDFPEAIFSDAGLLYLSHVSPRFPALFPDLPRTPWQSVERGIRFERVLPNGVTFGGSVLIGGPEEVFLQLVVRNGSAEPLRDIRLQTCAYLRAIREFSEFTQENKFIHCPDSGWVPYPAAQSKTSPSGRFRLGWRGGPRIADLPLMATLSNEAERLVAMTWYDSTYSLVGNPDHPCMHADPFFPDLLPGEERSVHGELLFFQGSLDAFGEWFTHRAGAGRPAAATDGARAPPLSRTSSDDGDPRRDKQRNAIGQ